MLKMEATHLPSKYKVEDGSDRIDAILSAGAGNFCDKDAVPSRSELTFINGFYVNVTSLFIDMVDSSSLPQKHKRPVVAKIYRAFISECVAIMNSSPLCCEVNINGDCVWGIFNTPHTIDIDNVFNASAKLNTLKKILNYKLQKCDYTAVDVGIGIDYGRALMIKAGYKGSGINDVVWMGDVVNKASHLAKKAGRNLIDPILITSIFYNNLNEKNKALCRGYNDGVEQLYKCNIVDCEMYDWFKQNCK